MSKEQERRAELITRYVAMYTGVNSDGIRQQSKKSKYRNARYLAMYYMRTHTNLPMRYIAEYMGGYEPGIVNHACERIRESIYLNNEFYHTVMRIHQKIVKHFKKI